MRSLLLITFLFSVYISQGQVIERNGFIYQTKSYSDSSFSTSVYSKNSKFLRIQTSGYNNCIHECHLKGKLPQIKKEVIQILKSNIPHLKPFRFVVSFLPRYNGTMTDVWFSWEGKQHFLNEKELAELTKYLLSISTVFESETNIKDTDYCQSLSFVINWKDWDYILDKNK